MSFQTASLETPPCSLEKKCDRVTGTGEKLAESPTVPLTVAWAEAQHPHYWHRHPRSGCICHEAFCSLPVSAADGPYCTQRPAGGLFMFSTSMAHRSRCVGDTALHLFLGHSISSAVTSSWGAWANFQGGDCSMLYVQPPSALIMMLKHSIGKASSIRNSNVTSQGMSTIKLSMNELQELLDC